MNTHEQEAKELIEKFDKLLPCEGTTTEETPKQCALILCEKMLSLNSFLIPQSDYHNDNEYWKNVYNEIQNL